MVEFQGICIEGSMHVEDVMHVQGCGGTVKIPAGCMLTSASHFRCVPRSLNGSLCVHKKYMDTLGRNMIVVIVVSDSQLT